MPESPWSIIVHGGARTIPEHRWPIYRDGCRRAVEVGAAILRDDGTALDAVERAVRALEDDPTFNAGTGSVPTTDGQAELDAAIMDGRTHDIGAVAALRGVRNPVAVARLLLIERPVLLVGDGAQAFAIGRGIELSDVPIASDEAMEGELEHDTVGCVAFDQHGNIAVATSTGGLPGQWPGRVGDAPIPGCGFYADNQVGGVAISGDGERILQTLLASQVVAALPHKSEEMATAEALHHLARVDGEAGIITISPSGRFGVVHNSDHFAVAAAASWLDSPIAGVHQDELKDINGD